MSGVHESVCFLVEQQNVCGEQQKNHTTPNMVNFERGLIENKNWQRDILLKTEERGHQPHVFQKLIRKYRSSLH